MAKRHGQVRYPAHTSYISQDYVTGRPCGQSARTLCESSWVRVPARPCAFSFTVTFGGQGGSLLGLRTAKGLSRRFRHGSEQIRGRILLSREKLSQVVRVARWLSGQSARTVCERSRVRVPVGSCAFFFPVTFRSHVGCHL